MHSYDDTAVATVHPVTSDWVQLQQRVGAAKLKAIIVTGVDHNHLDLVNDLIDSFRLQYGDEYQIGLIAFDKQVRDSGLNQKVDRLVDGSAEYEEFKGQSGYYAAYIAVKARLPELFPGFDEYCWVDADCWFCNSEISPSDFCERPKLRYSDPSRVRRPLLECFHAKRADAENLQGNGRRSQPGITSRQGDGEFRRLRHDARSHRSGSSGSKSFSIFGKGQDQTACTSPIKYRFTSYYTRNL